MAFGKRLCVEVKSTEAGKPASIPTFGRMTEHYGAMSDQVRKPWIFDAFLRPNRQPSVRSRADMSFRAHGCAVKGLSS